MKILQSGMEKSGNYWLYKIIQSALHRSGLPTTTYIKTQPIHALAKTWQLSYKDQADIDVIDIENTGSFYRISSIFRMPILDLDDYLAAATHVWTHSLFCQRCFEVFPKFDKIVYIIRDPRDVALSMARFQFTPYMQTYYPVHFKTEQEFLEGTFRRYMQRWVNHVGSYLIHAQKLNVYILFYERLLYDFDRELTLLLDYLDLTPTRELVEGIKQDTDFEKMRSENPSHVRKGKSNQWVSQLSEKQKETAVQYAGKLLTLLNYPTQDDQTDLPSFPMNWNAAMIEAAMASPINTRQRIKTFAKRLIP